MELLTDKKEHVVKHGSKVDKVELEAAKKRVAASLDGWKKKKRLCMNVIDTMLEDCPMSKQELLEKFQIVTDEEEGVTFPKFP